MQVAGSNYDGSVQDAGSDHYGSVQLEASRGSGLGLAERRLQSAQSSVDALQPLGTSTMASGSLNPSQSTAIRTMPASSRDDVIRELCTSIEGLLAAQLGDAASADSLAVECSAYVVLPPPASPLGGSGSGAALVGGASDVWVDCTWQWILAFLCGLLLGLILLYLHRRKLLQELADGKEPGGAHATVAYPTGRQQQPPTKANFYNVHGAGNGGGSGKGCAVMPTPAPRATPQPQPRPPVPTPRHAPDRALVRGTSAVHGAAPSTYPSHPPRPMPAPSPACRHTTPIERARAENARARGGVSGGGGGGGGTGYRTVQDGFRGGHAHYQPPPVSAPTAPLHAVATPQPAVTPLAASTRLPDPSTYHDPAGSEERRLDTDGSAYTYQEFYEYYGTEDNWNRAPPETTPQSTDLDPSWDDTGGLGDLVQSGVNALETAMGVDIDGDGTIGGKRAEPYVSQGAAGATTTAQADLHASTYAL